MKIHRIGIIMNGVTGRMGTNQHLIRSIKAIIDQGGVRLSDQEVIMPEPVLMGRNEDKLKALAARDNGVPFYVALPSSTIDWTIRDGLKEIPIEERSATEVTHLRGKTANGALAEIQVTPDGSAVLFSSRQLGDAAQTFAIPNRFEQGNQLYEVPIAGGRDRLALPFPQLTKEVA